MTVFTTQQSELFEIVRPLALSFFSAMKDELDDMGLTIDLPQWDDATLSTHRDPNDGTEVVIGYWESEDGGRIGSWLISPDGDGFADLDVLCRHPRRPRVFVEAISVYGQGGELKTSTRYQSRRLLRQMERQNALLERAG